MNNLFSLQGKRILITGSGQGIGYVMAQGWRNTAQKLSLTIFPLSGQNRPR